MRRFIGHTNGEQYLGNSNTKEVHDLDNEKTSCQIDEIIKAGHDVPFYILYLAHEAGYENCTYCKEDSTM